MIFYKLKRGKKFFCTENELKLLYFCLLYQEYLLTSKQTRDSNTHRNSNLNKQRYNSQKQISHLLVTHANFTYG